MELFKLFGSILINSDEADASLAKTDQGAEKVGNSFLKSVGTAAKWGAGIAAAAGVAALAVIGLAVNVGEDLQKALNGLQAETGATDESMSGLKDSMLAIYNNNFGDSFEDIGNSMALVAKQTGLTGKELESATTNALLMRDTFDMEVNGSITAVNQLMKQFGLTSEQSYNLMAQGAQNGMNAQDDLVDIVKEYSVQFKTMGFSAEEMFNMLSNGAKEGGFSIDVMGDAIKEFNIRSKDGSTATGDAFKSLGLNAGELTKAFGAGGIEGKAAFSKVSDALTNCKDPILQNQIGTALWGTMWEDLGSKSILALGNTEGKINDTNDALTKMNAIKYNTFGEAMEGIKRNLETAIFIPLSEKVLPKLSEFSTWVMANMPVIKQTIVDMATLVATKFEKIVEVVSQIVAKIFPEFKGSSDSLKTTSTNLVTGGLNLVITALTWVRDNTGLIKAGIITLTAVWVTQKGIVLAHNTALVAHNIVQAAKMVQDKLETGYIIALYTAQAVHTVAIKAGSVAQGAFNLVMSLNPIAKVILALTALGVGIYAVVKHWKEICEWIGKAWDWLTKWNKTEAKDKNANVNTNYTSTDNPSAFRNIGKNANGTDNWRGGLSWVGERGPELINLPKGSQVFDNNKSMQMANTNGGNSKAPITLQLVLQNGKAIAEFLVDDLDNLMGNKNKITGRSVGV